MLGIGLMFFCVRGLMVGREWRDGPIKFGFCAINVGLLAMVTLGLWSASTELGCESSRRRCRTALDRILWPHAKPWGWRAARGVGDPAPKAVLGVGRTDNSFRNNEDSFRENMAMLTPRLAFARAVVVNVVLRYLDDLVLPDVERQSLARSR